MEMRIGFLISVIGTLGSLFASEVLGYPPCVLCWYQRIALYPLAVVFGVALFDGDRGAWKYGLPLSLAGLVIAGYHNLLYYGVIPEKLSPCTQGVSCTTKQLEILGFLTIPLMSFVAFLVTAVIFIRDRNSGRRSS